MSEAAKQNLGGLIERIRQEALEKTSAEAASILEEARTESERLMAVAKERIERESTAAREHLRQEQEAAQGALRQAFRDAVLLFRQELEARLGALLETATWEALDTSLVRTILSEATQKWARSDDRELHWEILLSEEDRARLTDATIAALRRSVKDAPLEIRTHPEIAHGFWIGEKNGGLYLDFSAASASAALSQLVHERFRELFDAAGAGPAAVDRQ